MKKAIHPFANRGQDQNPIYRGPGTRDAYKDFILNGGYTIRHRPNYRKGVDDDMSNRYRLNYNANPMFLMRDLREFERNKAEHYNKPANQDDFAAVLRSKDVPRVIWGRQVPTRERNMTELTGVNRDYWHLNRCGTDFPAGLLNKSLEIGKSRMSRDVNDTYTRYVPRKYRPCTEFKPVYKTNRNQAPYPGLPKEPISRMRRSVRDDRYKPIITSRQKVDLLGHHAIKERVRRLYYPLTMPPGNMKAGNRHNHLKFSRTVGLQKKSIKTAPKQHPLQHLMNKKNIELGRVSNRTEL